MAITLLSVAIAVYLQIVGLDSKNRKLAKATVKEKESIGALIQGISKTTRDKLKSSCFSGGTSGAFASTPLTPRSRLRFFQSAPSSLSPRSQAAQRTGVVAALRRCQRLSGRTLPNNSFYFCGEITRDSTADKESFFNSEQAFIEVKLEIRNFANGTSSTCSDFDQGPPHGVVVYYSLYWLNQIGNQWTYKTKNGVVNVAK